ncbi:MAG TPA: hypothetical protein VH255_01245, partial [Verrucomicrobiae bacterium]|nr:hypothetical protein [Verrucomicrobiae bacterium]
MIRFALTLLCIGALGINCCLSQSNDNLLPTITKDVQLAITVTTNVFQAGSSSVIHAVTKNSATSAITVETAAPTINFD